MFSVNALLIQQAIDTKSQIHADYDGCYREMSPHKLGNKGQEEHALFVQFGGQTSKGFITPQTKEWRCMDVSKLENIRIVPGPFYDAEDNNRRPTNCID